MANREFEGDAAIVASSVRHNPIAGTSASHGAQPDTSGPNLAGGAAHVVATALQAPASPSAQRSVLQLQRDFGNQYVQRMTWIARQGQQAPEAGADVERTIQAKRGGGSALDAPVRGQMERAFQSDFSNVRIHQDGTSDSLNRSLEARAFTTGQDIFFRQGAYQPGTSGGRELIAHELTHVVQQTGDRVERKLQAKMSVSQPGDAYEVEADRMAQTVIRAETTPAATPQGSSQGLHRQPEHGKNEEDERKKMHRKADSELAREINEDERNKHHP